MENLSRSSASVEQSPGCFSSAHDRRLALAAHSNHGGLFLWNFETHSLVELVRAAFMHDVVAQGTMAVCIDSSNTVTRVDLTSQRVVERVEDVADPDSGDDLHEPEPHNRLAAFSADGAAVALVTTKQGHRDEYVQLRRTGATRPSWSLGPTPADASARGLLWAANGARLFVARWPHTVDVVSSTTGEVESQLRGEGRLKQAALSSDGQTLVTIAAVGSAWAGANELWVWNVASAVPTGRLALGPGWWGCPQFGLEHTLWVPWSCVIDGVEHRELIEYELSP